MNHGIHGIVCYCRTGTKNNEYMAIMYDIITILNIRYFRKIFYHVNTCIPIPSWSN